ncbi:hypothetical protein BaRGS_00024129, partial [Batillaria attramentaria]
TAGFEWTSTSFPDGTHLVHCPTDTVSFPWTFILSDDEFVQKVEWYFSPSNDEPVLALGRLHARVSRRVYHDKETDEYHVQLECGTILNPGDANFSVAWKTPKGHRLSSNSFINGVFYLPLPNPVKGGEYSCRLDRASVAVFKCPESKASLFKAAFVRVSETKSRSLVLETSLSHMKRQLEELRNTVSTVSKME